MNRPNRVPIRRLRAVLDLMFVHRQKKSTIGMFLSRCSFSACDALSSAFIGLDGDGDSGFFRFIAFPQESRRAGRQDDLSCSRIGFGVACGEVLPFSLCRVSRTWSVPYSSSKACYRGGAEFTTAQADGQCHACVSYCRRTVCAFRQARSFFSLTKEYIGYPFSNQF